MNNRVTIQFRKFQDIDRKGLDTGDLMYGYCIFNDGTEITNLNLSKDLLGQLMSKAPQRLLDYILEVYGEQFEDNILGTGFYISNDWYAVDDDGRVLD